MHSEVEPWVRFLRPNPDARLRLLCLPYGGGGSTIFRSWPDGLPRDIELWAIELPGRDTRVEEPPFDRLGPLVGALAGAIVGSLDKPFAVLGHSLGAIVGFELVRELRRRSAPLPLHLFVSGRRAPHLPDPAPMHRLPEPQFLQRLRTLGGIPEPVLDEPELMARFLPILRADFAVSETAVYVPEDPLDCPITAYGGATDGRASREELDGWRIHTCRPFDVEIFPGGHFFLQGARAELLRSISRHLSPTGFATT